MPGIFSGAGAARGMHVQAVQFHLSGICYRYARMHAM
jgi:hypothetical protein